MELKKLKLKKIKSKRQIIAVIISLIVIDIFLTLGFANSHIVDDGVELEPDTDLIYYIKVTYDGKDKNSVNSIDSTLSNVYSGNIYVEDILPNDLTFKEFQITDNGTIGALEQGTNKGCLGYVVDDSDIRPSSGSFINTKGLHYDTLTRKVSFTVNGLQAGCELTVGVVTRTPETVDDKNTEEVEVRRDIFNTAQAEEKKQVVISNTTHGYMGIGEEFLEMYNVSYKFDKEYPLMPSLPATRKYVKGATVSIPVIPIIAGYIFTGWKSEDITIVDGTFKMPDKDITLVGSFVELKDYTVSYKIDGEVPPGYEVPNIKSYSVGDIVSVDKTESGFVYNGYRFKGWTIDGIDISREKTFIMPENNVTIIGKFEKIKYKVSYQFTSEIKPDNADNLLPATEEYGKGENVKLKKVADVPGYKFLGWYSENEFKMPEHDVVINGEWKKLNGLFSPNINIEEVNSRISYKPGNVINYHITITNNESYAIRDVYVKKDGKMQIIKGDAYSLKTDNIILISNIEPLSSIVINGSYKVESNDSGILKNDVEVISALADNDYLFNETSISKDSVESVISSSLKICNNVNNGSGFENFGFHITSDDYDSWVYSNTSECKTIYLNPGRYLIQEVVPQEFRVDNSSQILTLNRGESRIVNFSNSYQKKNFYHSVKWLFKKIMGSGM